MKTIKFILYTFIFLCMFSCGEEEISINLDSEDPRLVVEGYVTTDNSPFYVVLTLSSEYFSNEEAPSVSGANVTINDGTTTYQLYETSSGLYQTQTSQKGEIGKNYELSITGLDIDNDGTTEDYTAESYLYPENSLDSTALEFYSINGTDYWKVRIWAVDDANIDNYYLFKTYTPSYNITPNIADMGYAEDTYFNGNNVVGTDVIWFVENSDDEDEIEYVLNLGDTIIVEMDGITEEYYNYINAVAEETSANVPIFSGPSANVPSNISNNALGFFTAYSISRDTILVDDDIINQRDK